MKRETVIQTLVPIGASVILIASSLLFIFATPEFKFREQSRQIDDLRGATQALSMEARGVQNEVAEIKNEVGAINDKIDRVTTKEIVEQLHAVDGRINDLSNQLASLQQIIAPSNASEILTVARMKNEIMARQDFESRFEKSIDGKLKDADERLKRTDDKLDNIQVWIWGSLLTFVAGLIGATLFLLQRFSQVVNSLAGGPQAAPVTSSNNPQSKDQKARPNA